MDSAQIVGTQYPEYVTLRVEDVRKLMGGYGVDIQIMENPIFKPLFEGHHAAVRRIAEEILVTGIDTTEWEGAWKNEEL